MLLCRSVSLCFAPLRPASLCFALLRPASPCFALSGLPPVLSSHCLVSPLSCFPLVFSSPCLPFVFCCLVSSGCLVGCLCVCRSVFLSVGRSVCPMDFRDWSSFVVARWAALPSCIPQSLLRSPQVSAPHCLSTTASTDSPGFPGLPQIQKTDYSFNLNFIYARS